MRPVLEGRKGGRADLPAVLFYLPTLEAGGAERVAIHHVNGLRRFRPVVLAQHLRGDLLAEVRPGVTLLASAGRTGPPVAPGRWNRARRRIRRARRRMKVRARRFRRRVARTELRLRARVRWLCGPRTIRLAERTERAARAAGRRIARLFPRSPRRPSPPRRLFARAPEGWLGLPFCAAFLLRQARILARTTRKEECGLVVSILPFTNGIAILAKLLFHRRLRVMVHVHSIKSRLLVEETPPHERFLIRQVVRRLYPRADRIVAASEGIREDLVRRFGVPDRKIRVVPNPIDRDRLLAAAAEEPENGIPPAAGPTVIGVGRLVRVKGFDILIRAFARLPDALGARLLLVGDGDERAGLERLAAGLGLDGRVVFAGFLANPWALVARADCLVLPSRTEGLPLVIGEAIALGVPVLAADCSPGVREFLPDETRGLLAPPEDPGALAAGMERLLTDRELRRRLARGARERLAPYDPARIRDTFERLMTETAG